MNPRARCLAPLIMALALAPASASAVEKTRQLQQSGDAVVGAPVPWFAGWTPDNRVLNRTKLLERPAAAHAIVLFATTCKPCEAGLRLLAEHRADLEASSIHLVLVAIGEPADVVRPWLATRGLTDATLVLDKFGRMARTLGATVTENGRQITRLPRTIVIDPEGVVRAILAEEGEDYLDLLRRAATPSPKAEP